MPQFNSVCVELISLTIICPAPTVNFAFLHWILTSFASKLPAPRSITKFSKYKFLGNVSNIVGHKCSFFKEIPEKIPNKFSLLVIESVPSELKFTSTLFEPIFFCSMEKFSPSVTKILHAPNFPSMDLIDSLLNSV